ncbi:hypothetical protein [Kitasatospora phosalacinea]|uniref:Uncharacterized protein n=1 Tax=Kitasatospora phosalacinea TaxID=2065 RepID=A0A9W6PEU6_9ACTN|nr:hypothetical protein [Kitasatospora phosalacinea]GLW53632.1 hypothetical protein Kpho01_16430 [Kitasatospora phosalacinea]
MLRVTGTPATSEMLSAVEAEETGPTERAADAAAAPVATSRPEPSTATAMLVIRWVVATPWVTSRLRASCSCFFEYFAATTLTRERSMPGWRRFASASSTSALAGAVTYTFTR